MNIRIGSKILKTVAKPKQVIKTVASFGYVLVVVFILFIGGITAISALKIPGGIRVHTVNSGSMEPAIRTGSIIVVKPANTYKVGDVIIFKPNVYRDDQNPPTSTTHRVYEIKEDKGVEIFVTKGDANDQPDIETVDKALIMGKVYVAIPFIGYLTNFIKTIEGLIILIIIPSVIIIYSELLNTKEEVKKIIRQRKNKREKEILTHQKENE